MGTKRTEGIRDGQINRIQLRKLNVISRYTLIILIP